MKVDQNQINKWKEKGLSVVERYFNENPDLRKKAIESDRRAITEVAFNVLAAKKPRRAKKQNKTEASYALQLEALKQVGEIYHYGWEEVTLKLADGTRFTPDFFVVRKIEMVNFATHWKFELIEIKGAHIWDDSKVKFKVARKMFPWFKFKMMQFKNQQWTELYPE